MTLPARTDASLPAPQGGFVARRGRPTSRQAAAIGEHILATAKEMFLSQGYAATSMEAVALAAGISKGTLYSRYPNKADLFRAIAENRLAAWGSVPAAEEPGLDVDISGYMRHCAAGLLATMRIPEIRAFNRLIGSEADRFPELYRSFHDSGYSRFIGTIVERLERSPDPTIRAAATSIATVFVNALLGWWQQESLLGEVSQEACDAYIDEVLNVVLGRDRQPDA